MTLIHQLWGLFSRRERWQVALLLTAMIVQAGAEMVGVASIAPFMSVLADPSVIESNEALRWAYETFGFADTAQFLMALGIAVIVVIAATNGISALVTWATLRFSAGAQHRLATRLVEGYLAQPYGFFVQCNTAKLNKSILSEVKTVITGVLKPVLNLIARTLVTVAIVALLVILDPFLALVVTVVLGGAYGVIYFSVRSQQRRLGQERLAASEGRYKVTAEAFGGIKDVKILEREAAFVQRFRPPSWRYSKTVATNATIAALPRYLLETVAFGGIILIALYYLGTGRGVAEVLPMLSLYAFAGYRLMPSLQQLFSGVASIRFNRAALDEIQEDMASFPQPKAAAEAPPPLPYREAIRFEDVRFRYAGAAEDALRGISLRIERNQTVGLVGPSGSGTTTLVDLRLGLYEPASGQILVDGTPLDASTLRAWRRQIGYVPQHIFLCDDTIANNIAFGVPAKSVDHARVEEAARIAHLHGFIQELPAGYDTVVGERGVRLSGGQRQRIGIARALYHDPQVLVMDEATSALDGVTEDAVMEAIQDLSGHKTIVLIAHRISTVRDCDRIYVLDRGGVLDEGTYDELTLRSASFRSLAKLEPWGESLKAEVT